LLLIAMTDKAPPVFASGALLVSFPLFSHRTRRNFARDAVAPRAAPIKYSSCDLPTFRRGGPGVNKAQNVKLLSIKLPVDVHEQLSRWAAHNVSSMNAELVRCARERAEREQAKAVG
jgi:hypothetical protein